MRKCTELAQEQQVGKKKEKEVTLRKLAPCDGNWKNGLTIIPTDKAVAVLGLELAIHVFLCLLHRDIHISVQASQDLVMNKEDQQDHRPATSSNLGT